jgi:parallel beta-helix repeat protein
MIVCVISAPATRTSVTNRSQGNSGTSDKGVFYVDSAVIADYVESSPFEIIGNEDFTDQGWPGNGTADSPFLIENLNITTSNSTGIRIVNVTVHFVIFRCLLVAVGDYYDPLIELERVSNGRVEECTIIDANIGAMLSHSSNSSFSRNTVINCWHGVFVSGGRNISIFLNEITRSRASGVILEGMTRGEILNNSFSNNVRGIGIWTSDTTIAGNEFVNDSTGIGAIVMGSTKLLIHDNRFLNISDVGISVESIEAGYAAPNPEHDPPPIYTVLSNNLFSDSEYGFIAFIGGPVLFANNHIERCGVGIYLPYTKGNRIVNNSVVDSLRYGIWLENAHLNTVYGNTISGSGIGNALDNDTGFNTWDNGIDTGNTWSNYNGTSVYVIDGDSSSIDRWPARCGPPFIWVQDNLEVVQGTTGNELLFWAFDSDPLSYEVWHDGVLVNSGPWDGRNLSVSVDLLGLGEYNFTVQVYDSQDGSTKAQCAVGVVEPDNSLLVASIGMTSIIIIILTAIFVQRKRGP